jgi:transcriptional regulator with XRE-family HTH domain
VVYAIEDIARILREARTTKGLSQRTLSAKVGLTQAHISTIENGAADVHLSNLIELARALDLEVMLVPRKAVPAVQGLVRNLDLVSPSESPGRAVRALERALEKLDALSPENKESPKLRNLTGALRNFRLDKEQKLTVESAAKEIQRINTALQKAKTSDLASIPNEMNRLTRITNRVRELRNAIVHAAPAEKQNRVQPRYRLDDEGPNG